MGSAQNNGGGGWLMDYGLCDEVSSSDFIWGTQIIDDPIVEGAIIGFDVPYKQDGGSDMTCAKKRNRTESCAAPGTKACREKLRRDKLNGRFMEMCSVLDPGRPPKADKLVILSDAVQRLNQLRLEVQKLKESNEALQDTIKNLKEEKSDLKDEKVHLKAEKDRIEQTLKCVNSPLPTFISHPSAAVAFHAPYKTVPYPNYLPVGMWQWLPPAALDTSQDHVLRPPVA